MDAQHTAHDQLPLWSIRRTIHTPLGVIERAVLFLGRPLQLHGATAEHALASAREMGFAGALMAVPCDVKAVA